MGKTSDIESRVAVTPAPELGEDVFLNENPLEHTQRAVYGGSLVCQSMLAASKTDSPSLHAYSLQSSFPSRANFKDKITYRVERSADGRSFATRTVRATQGTDATAVYLAIISFQRISQGKGAQVLPADLQGQRTLPESDQNDKAMLHYSVPKPSFLAGMKPDDIPPELFHQILAHDWSGGSVPRMQMRVEDYPFDWRPAFHGLSFLAEGGGHADHGGKSDPEEGDSKGKRGTGAEVDPLKYRSSGFFRASVPMTSDRPAVHLAALGYASDENFLAIPLYACRDKVGEGMNNVAVLVTMTQDVYFHDTGARADRWMTYERSTTWAEDGRVIVGQKVWDYDTGRLVFSGSQTGLLRLKGKL